MPPVLQICLFCGHAVQLVHVHGHYQCPVCCTNALPCCDGDNCDTNYLLNENAVKPAAARRIMNNEQGILNTETNTAGGK
jgi:hypothetical protein